MYFLRHIEIKKGTEFHDNGSVYGFIDVDTETTETLTQWY